MKAAAFTNEATRISPPLLGSVTSDEMSRALFHHHFFLKQSLCWQGAVIDGASSRRRETELVPD